MRVGIVGAGVAGLGAARLLAQERHEVVVFERLDRVGGRCATTRIGPFIFDPGATSIAPRGKALEPVMLSELDTSDLAKVLKPIYIHNALRVMPGDPSHMRVDRYTYHSGNEILPFLLASGIEVRTGKTIEYVRPRSQGYELENEEFDAVILATPLPETVHLLSGSGEQRSIGHVFYRACISVLLGYDKEMPEINYHAIVDPEQRHPLTWLSIESVKCSGRAPEGQTAMVAQLSPQYSKTYFDAADSAIVTSTVEYIQRLYGIAWSTPIVHEVVRWRYSQPENLALFDSVNHPSARLVIASDGLLGGRVEFAFEVGDRAAKLLMHTG